MENIGLLIERLNRFFWNGPIPVLLCITHFYFTFRLRFVQRHTIRAIRCSLGGSEKRSGEKSALRTLTTALAATLGTGNIVGISTAVALGGAGAVFWCWLTGIFGMATTYAESYLGMRYQQTLSDGTRLAGPMVALHKGLKSPVLSFVYAFFLLLSGLSMSATTSAVLQEAGEELHVFPSDSFLLLSVSGILVALLIGFAIKGGAKAIGKLCMCMVPGMTLFYFAACAFLLFLNCSSLLPALSLIVGSAFGFRSVTAGILGGSLSLALRYGIARGLFSNEAGLGSGAVAASDSSDSPETQGLISMSATFWDTVVMCGLTGLVIVSSILIGGFDATKVSSGELVHAAFSVIPLGRVLLNLSLCSFALATLIGWYYIAEKAVTQLSLLLFGEEMRFVTALRIVYMLSICLGFLLTLDFIFSLSDFFNAILVLPNLFLLFRLRKEILPVTKAPPPKA